MKAHIRIRNSLWMVDRRASVQALVPGAETGDHSAAAAAVLQQAHSN